MKRKFIPVEGSFKKWKKDPEYVAAHVALEKEFAIASAMILPSTRTLERFARATRTRLRISFAREAAR